MRTLLCTLLAFSVAGCGTKRCKDGTVLVAVDLEGGTAAADQLDVVITTAGAPVSTTVPHTAGDATGALEVDFPTGFPAGKAVTVRITARAGAATLGVGDASLTPAGGCDATTVHVMAAGGGVDLSMPNGDGPLPPDMTNPCPLGQQDNDGDGVCMPDCASSGLSCMQPHMVCSDASGTAGCVCHQGYKLVGTTCTWVEVPLDPTFENTPPSSWTLSGGAVIDPLAAGLGELGNLVISKNSMCSSLGMAKQSFMMPSFADSEPFTLNVTTQADCVNGMFPCGFGTAIGVNGGVELIPFSSTLKNYRVCVGERAYGGNVDVRAAAGDRQQCATATTLNLVVDHFGIIPDATCPAPGTIPNGNFEAASIMGNWVPVANSGTANIVAGAGQAGTAGGHLATTNGCQFPSATDRMSFPWKSMTNLAIQFAFKGNLGFAMQYGDGTTTGANPNWGELTGDGGAFQTYSACVPEYVKGMVHPFRVSTFTTAQACATAEMASSPTAWPYRSLTCLK